MTSEGEGKNALGSMRTNKSNCSEHTAMTQYNADARLLAAFEQSGESGKSFDYSQSVVKSQEEKVLEEDITAYLSKIQRGGLIQPFGCLLAIEETTFKIIAYSKNAIEILGVLDIPNTSQAPQSKGLLGVDGLTLFTPLDASSLARAATSREISLSNPIWVHSRTTMKPFYAILHRIDVGIVIDLEPAISVDPALSIAGAVHSQKLAVRAISRLQSLTGGDIGLLCDTVVEEVQALTGYDRVMVYKFHDDEHGEVVSEMRRSDLEPYLGLHYPSTDIPQAPRFLFKQNRVRMIVDCNAKPIEIIQDSRLNQSLCLVNSTLRSPHGCHMQYMANMGSIASLVMAIVINGNDSSKLWGLVVCHHTSTRYLLFPIRYACEFLMQAFGLQLNMEIQLATQMAEKKMLRTQTLLCDMLLRDAPLGIITQSPNIMDLVKCDGAALYYGGLCWIVGVTPTKDQIKDIAEWLLSHHGDTTGLSTDSLAESGYPGAASLGDAVCGMAAARITSKDFLFWFRSHTAKEVKWGGAKHHPEDKDDGTRMHPRSSFKAFLEVVKSRSLPWELLEINSIHSLQVIIRRFYQDIEDTAAKMKNHNPHANNLSIQGMNEVSSVAYEMVRLIETATAPIFAVNSSGLINGWNAKTAELTGLSINEAMGKSLVCDLVHEDSREIVKNHLSRALLGVEGKNIELKLMTFGTKRQDPAVFIVANTCSSKDYMNCVVGVCFVGQDVTTEKVVLDKFIQLQGDYEAVIQSLNPLIPPIFASDENARCLEWNTAMEKLAGWSRRDVIGKTLVGEIFGDMCHMKDQDDLTKFMIMLYRAIGGHETDRFSFAFFNRKGKYVEALLTSNQRLGVKDNVVGCFFFLQTTIPDLHQALKVQKHQENKYSTKLKELAYVRQQMKNPLHGLQFTHKLLESLGISDDRKQLFKIITACEKQLMNVIEDMDSQNYEEGCMEPESTGFILGELMDAILSQVMFLLREKKLELIRSISDEFTTLSLFGDQIRLQQVLTNFLLSTILHAPFPDSWVEIEVTPSLRLTEDGNDVMHLQFRMTHPGKGLPSELVQYMFNESWLSSPEGLGLNMSRKFLKKMGGRVQYVREHSKCYFLIDIQLPTAQRFLRSKSPSILD